MKKSFLCWALFSVLAFAGCDKVTPEPDPGPTPDPTVSKATAVMNLTPDFISLSGIEEGAENEAETKLTLTLTPGEILSSGFSAAHMEHIHVHVADTVYMPEFPAGVQEEYVQSLSLEIEVPDADYEVVACYSGQQQFSETGYTMYLEENEDDVRLYGVSPEKKYRYFDCYLLTPDAYTITGIEFKVGDGEWQDIDEVNGCSYGRSELVDNVYGISIRHDYQDVTGDVTIRVSGEQHGRNGDEQNLRSHAAVLRISGLIPIFPMMMFLCHERSRIFSRRTGNRDDSSFIPAFRDAGLRPDRDPEHTGEDSGQLHGERTCDRS